MNHIKSYSWSDFDQDIAYLARQLKERPPFQAIFGMPRGGLVVAVALSHRLKLPLVQRCGHGNRILWVDDIADSGRTIAHADVRRHSVAVLIQRISCSHEVLHARTEYSSDWILFPWEDVVEVEKDRQDYEGHIA